MNQLYTRIFTQILTSSIAEDWRVRHIFEDFLKLCDPKTGVVDMTRQAISRQLNIPLDEINRAISVLEAPDRDSRDPAEEGCRLRRLDAHRDWGWAILNWDKYEGLRCRKDVNDRVKAHRAKVPDIDEEKFGQFWQAYPRKVSMGDAKRAFAKVKVPVEELIAALESQKQCVQWVKDEGQFIPYPATWLNAGRWTDEVKPSNGQPWSNLKPESAASIRFGLENKLKLLKSEVKRLKDEAPQFHMPGYKENQPKIASLKAKIQETTNELLAL